MKTKGIIFFHLIIWLLLGVGCASKKTNRSLASQGDTPSSRMELGQAYDSLKNQFVEDASCIKIPEDRVKLIKPPVFGNITARMNMNASELAEETLWGLGARINSRNTDVNGVAVELGELAKISTNRFTSNMVYSLKVSGGREYLSAQAKVTSNIPSDLLGDDPKKIKERRERCGDSYLSSKELGATLQAVLTFEFDNEESKKFFDAQTSMEIPIARGEGEGFRTNLEYASQNAKISLKIIQLGGDPSRLSPMVSNDCVDLKSCMRVMDDFLDYSAKFGNQFKDEKGKDLGLYAEGNYTFNTYDKVDHRFEDISLEDGAKHLLDSYRELIANQFVDEYSLLLRSESLFKRITNLDSSRKQELKNAQYVLDTRMEAITHAMRTCYGLDVDPESKEGSDSIVTKCGSMVNQLNAFLYDKGPMNTEVNCKMGDPGIPADENPESEGTRNWYYPMIRGRDRDRWGSVRWHCSKIDKADIKFDPMVLAINAFSIRDWLQKYDRWFELLVKSKISKNEDSKARFKALAKNLLSDAELFSLFQILRNDFKDRTGKKIDLKYDEFDVFDSMDHLQVNDSDDTWKSRKWVIGTTTISNIEGLECKSLRFDKGAGVQSFIQSLDPFTSLKSLEALDLSQNRVSDLTPLRYLPKLSILFLDGNPIRQLSTLGKPSHQIKVVSLRKLPTLKEDGTLESHMTNPMTNPGFVKLQDELVAFKNLEQIDLSENSPWPVQEIANVPGGFPRLREIYLANLTAKTKLEKKKWAENIKALIKSIIEQRETKFPELEKIYISIDGVSYDHFAPEEIIGSLEDLKIGHDFLNPTGLNFSRLEPCTN